MELVFKILAAALACVAAYFFWVRNPDYAFVAAVFGAVAFFLSIRFEVKKRNAAREAERERATSDVKGMEPGADR